MKVRCLSHDEVVLEVGADNGLVDLLLSGYYKKLLTPNKLYDVLWMGSEYSYYTILADNGVRHSMAKSLFEPLRDINLDKLL